MSNAGAIPKRLAELHRNVKRYVLPPRRKRSYPRAIKLKMSAYNRKKPAAETAR